MCRARLGQTLGGKTLGGLVRPTCYRTVAPKETPRQTSDEEVTAAEATSGAFPQDGAAHAAQISSEISAGGWGPDDVGDLLPFCFEEVTVDLPDEVPDLLHLAFFSAEQCTRAFAEQCTRAFAEKWQSFVADFLGEEADMMHKLFFKALHATEGVQSYFEPDGGVASSHAANSWLDLYNMVLEFCTPANEDYQEMVNLLVSAFEAYSALAQAQALQKLHSNVSQAEFTSLAYGTQEYYEFHQALASEVAQLEKEA
jgi:hypothetical protein